MEQLSPRPGLADLPALAAQMQAAGLSTTLRIEGTPPPGGESLDLTAYRIVQEALTNTVKHAHARQADIRVCYGPDAIDVSVSDDGRGCAEPAGLGHGLAGMRERASLYGGIVTAGDGPAGGYSVTAHLPLSLLFNLCARAGKALPGCGACRRDMRWPPQHRRF